MTKLGVAITAQDYDILVNSVRNVLGIRPSQTLGFLERFLQAEYDNLEDKSGNITLHLPTPEKLIKWIKEKK